VARWKKRKDALEYLEGLIGLTKLSELISDGVVEAKKEPGHNSTVFVNLDSLDSWIQNLPKAPRRREGLKAPALSSTHTKKIPADTA
jgi:hypothetical protein